MTETKPTKSREWWIKPREGLATPKTEINLSELSEFDVVISVVERSALTEAQAEIERLKKIIAKELSENDEIGCEYTYVNVLKERIKELESHHKDHADDWRRIQDAERERDKLKSQNAALVAALEFYADEGKWESRHVCDSYTGSLTTFDWPGDLTEEPWQVAGEALARLRGEK